MARLHVDDLDARHVDYVTLNGVRAEKVIMADEEQGLLQRYITNEFGRIDIDAATLEPLTTYERGVVVIHYQKDK